MQKWPICFDNCPRWIFPWLSRWILQHRGYVSLQCYLGDAHLPLYQCIWLFKCPRFCWFISSFYPHTSQLAQGLQQIIPNSFRATIIPKTQDKKMFVSIHPKYSPKNQKTNTTLWGHQTSIWWKSSIFTDVFFPWKHLHVVFLGNFQAAESMTPDGNHKSINL